MGKPLDPDVKKMTLAERGREIMRLRTAFRRELDRTGNHRCWITLMEAVDGKRVKPLTLPKQVFIGHCNHYYDRNA